ERLRVTDASCLPVRVAQDKVINEMRKRLPIDRHPQFPGVRKIRLAQFARPMFLRKEHLSWRSFGCSPITNPAPQCPHLPVTEPARMRLLQMLKDGLSLQPWFDREQLTNLFPAIGERIRPRSPRMLLSHLAR